MSFGSGAEGWAGTAELEEEEDEEETAGATAEETALDEEEGAEEGAGAVSAVAGGLPSGSAGRPRGSEAGCRFLPPPSLQLVTSGGKRGREQD